MLLRPLITELGEEVFLFRNIFMQEWRAMELSVIN